MARGPPRHAGRGYGPFWAIPGHVTVWADLEEAHHFVTDFCPELKDRPLPVVQREMRTAKELAENPKVLLDGPGPMTQEEKNSIPQVEKWTMATLNLRTS